ncbi:hypothetical protein ABZ901_24380 [Actinacidiphila alni]|uniref:hypothetical protein n=1 Tax=Actinacidiphila alni TaxID=380248 RepID=UPI0033F01054
MSRRTGLRGRLRQRRFPPEFRIPAAYPARDVRDAAPVAVPEPETGTGTGTGSEAVIQLPAQATDSAPDAALADLATNLWRLGRKLAEDDGTGVTNGGADGGANGGADGGRSATNRRRAARHLRAAQDALGKAGVTAQDHDGMAFDIGLALDVLAYQPVPGAARESVHETVRPSVYRDGRRIQLGQVIVARPEEDPEEKPEDEPDDEPEADPEADPDGEQGP